VYTLFYTRCFKNLYSLFTVYLTGCQQLILYLYITLNEKIKRSSLTTKLKSLLYEVVGARFWVMFHYSLTVTEENYRLLQYNVTMKRKRQSNSKHN